MRRIAVVLAIASLSFPFSGFAQETPPTVDRAAVISACTQQTVRPDGSRADEATTTSYCTCMINVSAEVFTPAEFDAFARYGLSRSNMGPAPTDEELRSFETPEFMARAQTLTARMRAECSPILLGGAG